MERASSGDAQVVASSASEEEGSDLASSSTAAQAFVTESQFGTRAVRVRPEDSAMDIGRRYVEQLGHEGLSDR
eukprot:7099529-Alexandrium_andersonii.AAC.1